MGNNRYTTGYKPRKLFIKLESPDLSFLNTHRDSDRDASKTGAADAYAAIARKHVHSKKQAESASLILSCLFFIDDYFSALTVGSVMRPLARHYGVHPVKLAFLTTAMATPLAILSPISSWVGEIMLQLKLVGIGPAGTTTVLVADPYLVLIHSYAYAFYPIMLIIGTWYIVLRSLSYGPMQKYDSIAPAKYAGTHPTEYQLTHRFLIANNDSYYYRNHDAFSNRWLFYEHYKHS